MTVPESDFHCFGLFGQRFLNVGVQCYCPGWARVLRRGRLCVFMLNARLVFVTRYCGKVFHGEHLLKCGRIFWTMYAAFETELTEFGGEQYHVHLLA